MLGLGQSLYTQSAVSKIRLLLDTYQEAAAAYSIRKLSQDYSGSCMMVERADNGLSTDIGFDRNGDLDTAAIATFCSGTTCGVRVWYDQSGNGNDATQTTFANQPTIYTGGAVVLRNTKPAIIDNTSGNNSLNLTYSVVDGSWIFAVCQIETAFTAFVQGENANKFLLVGQDGVGSSPNLGVSNVNTYIDGTSQSLTSRNVVYDTFQQQRLLSLSFDNDTWTQFNIGYPGSGSVDMMTMQEIVLYPSNQSTNRSGIETNVNDYFGIYTPFTTGLLDDYGGAAAAYSLRRLSSTYTGDAIRVRRASDNAEQDIGFDIEGNLNTAALASFCSGTDGFVVKWYDQSGNSNDATQTTTASQPKIYDSATGVVTENAKPAVSGFVDYQGMPFTSTISLTNQSVLFVGKVSYEMIMLGSNDYAFFNRSGATIFNTNGVVDFYSALSNSAQTLLSYFRNTSNNEVFQDATSVGTNSGITTQTSDYDGMATYNRALAAGGIYQELIIYPSDQSANRTGIESNINTFYSIY